MTSRVHNVDQLKFKQVMPYKTMHEWSYVSEKASVSFFFDSIFFAVRFVAKQYMYILYAAKLSERTNRNFPARNTFSPVHKP